MVGVVAPPAAASSPTLFKGCREIENYKFKVHLGNHKCCWGVPTRGHGSSEKSTEESPERGELLTGTRDIVQWKLTTCNSLPGGTTLLATTGTM